MTELTTLEKFRVLSEVACKSQSTIRSYERYISEYVRMYGEHPPQEKIIDYLYHLKVNQGLDKSSLNVAKFAIQYYYTDILQEQISIKLPSIPRRKSVPKPVDKSIIKRLIDAANNEKHRLLIVLAYDAGLRPFELVKLEWEWIDLNSKQGFINHGKFDKDRPMYLSERAVADLMHWRDQKFKGRFEQTEIRNGDRKYVFFSEDNPNYHICKRTYENVVKQLSAKAGITLRMYPYRIRHSFATHLQDSGVPVENIRPRMGHNNIKTTLGYAKVKKPEGDIKSPLDDEIFNQIGDEVSHNH